MKKRVKEVLEVDSKEINDYNKIIESYEEKIVDFVRNSDEINNLNRENDVELLKKIINVTDKEFLYRTKNNSGKISPYTKLLIRNEILTFKENKMLLFFKKIKILNFVKSIKKVFSDIKNIYRNIKEYYEIKKYQKLLVNRNNKYLTKRQNRILSFRLARNIKESCELNKRLNALHK
jgi:hypothetical protein